MNKFVILAAAIVLYAIMVTRSSGFGASPKGYACTHSSECTSKSCKDKRCE